MMNGRFVITRGARDLFVDEDELRRKARSGQLLPQDRVYHPQLGRWLYAREVAEVERELQQGAQLGRRPPPEQVVLVPVNGPAVAGFILGALGCLPLAGLPLALGGVWLSARGLGRAQVSYGSGHRLAAAGLVLSLLLMMPQISLLLWTLYG